MYARSINLLLAAALVVVPSVTFAAPTDFDKQMESYLSKDENVEKIGTALEKYFVKRQQQQQAKAAETQKQKMEDQFKNPVKVDIGRSPVRGPESAPITIVEFSDFQCPYCQRGAEIMEQVLAANPKNVKLVFKNLPLPMHPQAKPAAIAALAAGAQGKFWEMHDLLFKNQGEIGKPDTFTKFASQIGLDVEKFKKDMENPEYGKMVEADMAQAEGLGIQGTPGFVVNGVQVTGAQPVSVFQEIINRWLKK